MPSSFSDWYDEEHVPARFVVPGWYTSARLVAIDDQEPRQIVFCDLDSVEAIERPEYTGLYDSVSQLEQDIVKKLETLHRRMYTVADDTNRGNTTNPAESFAGTKFVTFTFLKFSPDSKDGEKSFSDWYKSTLLPALQQVPGWTRSRHYDLVSNDDWAGDWSKHDLPILLVHETADNNVPEFISIGVPKLEGLVDVVERRFKVATLFKQPDGKPQPQ